MAAFQTFGQWLRQRRKTLDLTQRELADLVGCSVATVEKLEAGTRRPSKQIAARLICALNMAPALHEGLSRWARGVGAAPPALLQTHAQPTPAELAGSLRRLPDRHIDDLVRQPRLCALVLRSYARLPPHTQKVFARLSVFADGWTAAAAQAVCVATHEPASLVSEGLATLLEHGLVQRSGASGAEVRFLMPPAVREFAQEQLAACGETEIYRQAHTQYYLAQAKQALQQLAGDSNQIWPDQPEADRDNVAAALAWTIQTAALKRAA